ncbi:MAG: glycosyltransferase [Anaerolinea sp.]|nr:glycosyltransferase [Anaerolinea sp.]
MAPFHALKEHGVCLHPVALPHSAPHALQLWIRFFRKIQPQIVHFNDPCPIPALASRLACIPHRVVMHHTPELQRRYNLIGRLAQSAGFKSCSRVIFSNSLSMRTAVEKDRIPPSKAVVIPFGIAPEWFAPIDREAIARVRAELGLQPSSVVILCPARLAPQKRHDLLIEAAEIVVNRAPEAQFLFAGDGELRADIEQRVAASTAREHIRLLGQRSDIQSLISASDLVTLASDFEGFPYVLMEAAARGIPAVATDVGGVSLSIRHGETGLLVPTGDPEALAEALLRLITNRAARDAFSSAARAHAEADFSKDAMVRSTAALYRSLIGAYA